VSEALKVTRLKIPVKRTPEHAAPIAQTKSEGVTFQLLGLDERAVAISSKRLGLQAEGDAVHQRGEGSATQRPLTLD